MMEPESSTPRKVPLVPMGGAYGSSIWSSSTRHPTGYSTVSLRRNCMVGHLLSGPGLESTVAGEVAEQDFPLVLEFSPDEAQPEEEAPEGVLIIVSDFLLLVGDALLAPGHITEDGNQVGVGLGLISVEVPALEPGEGNRVGAYLHREGPQGLADEPTLGGEEAGEVDPRLGGQAGGGEGDRQAVAVGLGGVLGGVGLGDGILGVEPLALQLRHQRIDVAVVATVLEADRAVL